MTQRQRAIDATSKSGLQKQVSRCFSVGVEAYFAETSPVLMERTGQGSDRSDSYFIAFNGKLLPMKVIARMAQLQVSGLETNFNSVTFAPVVEHYGFEVAHFPVKGSANTPQMSVRKRQELAYRLVLARPEQAKFRDRVMRSCSGRCVISGTSIPEALEACHIKPFCESGADTEQNGLLLRKDLHGLFDNYLISINPDTKSTWVAKRCHDDFGCFRGKRAAIPSRVSSEFLALHWKRRP